MLSRKAQAINPSPTMTIDSKAKEMKNQGIDVTGFGVDVTGFGAGEPDFDTPAHIREAATKAMNEGHTRYTPAAGTPEIKETICNKLKTDNGLEYKPNQVVVSNGAKHALFNALAAIIDPADEVLIPAPYWVSYPELVKICDGIPVIVETSEVNKLKTTAEELEKYCSGKTKALILNSPHNPTGQVYSEEELRAIAELCREKGVYVIADEIYEKLIYKQARHVSIASFNEEIKDLTILVNGVSKSYAMTGWRIGYTASTPEIAGAIAALQSHTSSNPNSIAQKAAVAAMQGDQSCVSEMRRAFDERRRYIYERITAIPCLDALEPEGTFYLFVNVANTFRKSYQGKEVSTSDTFAQFLLESRKVAVVPGTGFGAPDYVRLTFATSMENIEEGINRIEAFTGDLR